MKRPTITLHVVTSLDGFIARPDGDVSWLNRSEGEYAGGTELTDDDVERVLAGIDAYVIGSHTYEHALELGWPYGDTPVIVATNRDFTTDRPNVEFHGGHLTPLVRDVLAPRFENVWLAGGADLAQSFLARGLVDRMILTVAPVVLGDGIRLFGEAVEQHWSLEDVVAFKTGFIETTYVRRSEA